MKLHRVNRKILSAGPTFFFAVTWLFVGYLLLFKQSDREHADG
jgi:hypothetical protein